MSVASRPKIKKIPLGVNCQKPTNRNHAKIRNHRRHRHLVLLELQTCGMTYHFHLKGKKQVISMHFFISDSCQQFLVLQRESGFFAFLRSQISNKKLKDLQQV